MAEQTAGRAMEELVALMERLRDPDAGCPWDLKQNYQSIAPSTIEEAYEVVDAIERKDYPHLKEELGDLLFQVVFYAQLGREDGLFDFADIARGITAKLIHRHPHVFPDGRLDSRPDPDNPLDEAAVKAQWETIKQEERSSKGQHGVLADVPVALPAIQRAQKLQQRAARVGFDWANVGAVLDKVQEELDELKEAVAQGAQDAVEAELGDALFSLINVARHLKVDAETALRGCNQRFVQRFNYMEHSLEKQGRRLEEVDIDELEALWQEAKRHAQD